MSSYIESLETIASGVVATSAAAVDADGAFPSAALAQLGGAGLLGLISAKEVGGLGEGPRAAVLAIERLARECGTTAMVVCMHYAGAAVIERYGDEATRRAVASGASLTTLAFSEAGSRSQFWAPVSRAEQVAGGVALTGRKSWVTSASHADVYVWSSRPLAAEGASTIWAVRRDTRGLRVGGRFDGLGLRGNDSTPVTAELAIVPERAMLGADGAGLEIMLGTVLPLFNLMNAACSVGLMEAATARAIAHVTATGFEHDGTALRDLPTIRAGVARMRVQTDAARALVLDAADAVAAGRDDAMLRVLECKAAAGEAALAVTDLGMRVCGGAAFRKEVGVERVFRDARAGAVMAPTVDHLYEFIGRAVCGMPVFG